MASMISTVDTILLIPAFWKGFPNENPLVIKMQSEKAEKVPDFVLKYYTKNRPQQFREASQPRRPAEVLRTPPSPKGPPPFDAKSWLLFNAGDIKNTIGTLERPNKFAVAKYLNLSNFSTQPNERIDERIIEDITVKLRQQDVLSQYKPVTPTKEKYDAIESESEDLEETDGITQEIKNLQEAQANTEE